MRRTVGGAWTIGAALALGLCGCQLVFPLEGYAGGAADGAAMADATRKFCDTQAPPPAFCADFDEGALLAGWTSATSVPGSTVDLDVSSSVSAPASLVANLPDGNGSTRLYRVLSVAVAAAHVDFDLRIDRFDQTGNVNAGVCVLSVDFGDAHELRLVTGALRSYLEEQRVVGGSKVYQGFDLSPIIPTGRWVHVRLDVETSSPATGKITVDGQLRATAALDPSWAPAAPSIAAGAIFAVNTSAAWTAHLDDIVMRTE